MHLSWTTFYSALSPWIRSCIWVRALRLLCVCISRWSLQIPQQLKIKRQTNNRMDLQSRTNKSNTFSLNRTIVIFNNPISFSISNGKREKGKTGEKCANFGLHSECVSTVSQQISHSIHLAHFDTFAFRSLVRHSMDCTIICLPKKTTTALKCSNQINMLTLHKKNDLSHVGCVCVSWLPFADVESTSRMLMCLRWSESACFLCIIYISQQRKNKAEM